ncbi:MAG: SDR family oxidoreductase [Actinomycetota bacterium]|nr:SDR family oxidoreductase [Actinomycetota bacterium]MDP2288487.1 SDR family oxidoreductase [Actinomycetota bacterium]
MDLELVGKRALVTGGSRGIGKAIARALANEGCDVVVTARGDAALRATATEISSATGRRIVPIVADTSSSKDINTMVDAAVAALGGVDILVNNAARPGGSSVPPRMADITAEEFWEDMNVKVLGYLQCAQAVVPHMLNSGWGRIISISGLAARSSGSTVGSMRNVAVAAMTKNLADELGPRGINVTVVHPGGTRTEASAGKFEAIAEARGISAAEVERLMGSNSIGRMVDAAEVAVVVTFLASPRSIAINGDAIAVGGGTPGPIYY